MLIVHDVGPSVTVQDAGRPGHLAQGLSQGGAADMRALAEGAALLGHGEVRAALELAGMGGTFEVTEEVRIALTGAPMVAEVEGRALAWNASHLLPAGARLRIGAAQAGVYGYLHFGGGIDTPVVLGSRSAHLTAGLGRVLRAGDRLRLGRDAGGPVGRVLVPQARFSGGTLRLIEGPQTGLFTAEVRARLVATPFLRDARGNRQGVALRHDGAPFSAAAQLTILSEIIVPGDIQMTGAGMPFILLAECQTTGGYPRIGTVIPDDLPLAAQAGPGAAIRFVFIGREEARRLHRPLPRLLEELRAGVKPLIRDPRLMPDLLSYQLISGVTAGNDLEGTG